MVVVWGTVQIDRDYGTNRHSHNKKNGKQLIKDLAKSTPPFVPDWKEGTKQVSAHLSVGTHSAR